MSESSKDDETFLIAFSDFRRILKKNFFKIAFASIFFAFLLGTYALTKPIQYEAEATFKEKSNSKAGLNTSSVASMIFNGFNSGGQSEARTMMRSRKLLKDLIQPLNLQGTLRKKMKGSALLNRIRENLIVENHYYNKRSDHPLPDLDAILSVKEIEFKGEIPISISLVFDSEDTYQVYDNKKKKVGTGRTDTPFSTKEFRFTIARLNDTPVTSDTYALSLSPLKDVAYTLSKCIDIESDKDDSSLLKITYLHRNRHLACKIINELMTTYQGYLRKEQQRISKEQIGYLHTRKRV